MSNFTERELQLIQIGVDLSRFSGSVNINHANMYLTMAKADHYKEIWSVSEALLSLAYHSLDGEE